MTKIIRKAATGEQGNAGEFGTHNRPDSTVELTVAPDFSGYEALDYWERVRIAGGLKTDPAILQHIVDSEFEDDFMSAIAGNPSATGEQIELVSRHHSAEVRRRAIGNRSATDMTLERIEREAQTTSYEHGAERRAQGRNPNSSYLEHMTNLFDQIGREARLELTSRAIRKAVGR